MFSMMSARERFARRHTVYIPAKRAIYTYIPKNGCTTLRFSIAVANGRPDNPETAEYIHAGMPQMVASNRDLANCDYAFIVLRCPYRRIASAFLDKAVGDLLRAATLFPRQRRIFGRSKPDTSEAGLAATRAKVMALTFADFADLLQNCNSKSLDHHFRPQTEFLLNRDYDDYFALEQLAQAEIKLRAKIDFRLVDKGGHGISKRNKSDVDASKLTIAGLLALLDAGFAPSYQSLFTETSRRAVETFYAADLALYKKHFGANDLLFPS